MKPPGGNYKPDRINVNKIPNKATSAAFVNAAHAAGADAAAGAAFIGGAGGAATTAAAATTTATAKTAAAAAATTTAAATTATEDYRTAKVMTASPAELILIMYEQFFELIPDIQRNIRKHSAAAMEPDSERAQAIVEELINALDFDVELSKDIGAIYYYVRNRILEANILLDANIWDDIEAVMRSLYDGFKEASSQLEPQMKQAAAASPGPAIVAGMTYGQSSLKEVVLNTRSGIKV